MSEKKDRLYVDNLSFASRIRRFFWSICNSCLFRWTPRFLFRRWRINLLRIFGAKIGRGCKVDPSCYIWAPWNLTMGDFVCLAGGVDMYTVDKVNIGSNTTISQRAFICTASHDIKYLQRPLIHAPIIIEDHAWVCAEAFVGGGVTIHEGAVVAARAVVTRDVVAWTVVAGNPANFFKKRELLEQE